MTVKEQRRAQVLTQVLSGVLRLEEAAMILRLSLRQVRRLKGRYATGGPAALAHGNRGRASPRRLPAAVRERVVQLYRARYQGCNYQHFTELLAEREQFALSPAAVGRILNAAGLRSPQRHRVRQHRARRVRMPAEGLLLQADGSPHHWLGPSGPRWTLISLVDDATSAPVAAVFREQEDAAGYFLALRQVVASWGIPAAVYHDRHSIFHTSGTVRPSLEDQLAGVGDRPSTQFGRLLAELGVGSISAHSPQAKGRVERSWRTHQDRLVAELRLAGVQTMAQANAFLPGYLVRYRSRFAVAPARPEPAYVPIDAATNLDLLFCFKYRRRVAPDNTVQFAGRVFQIPPGPDRLSYARALVELHQRLDGSIALYYQRQQLALFPVAPGPQPPLRTRWNPTSVWRSDHSLDRAQAPAVATVSVAGGQRPALSTGPTPAPAAAGRRSSARTPRPDHPWRKGLGGHFH